jgi:hypothetical protein
MNSLRLVATTSAYAIGFGGGAMALSNLPFDALVTSYPPPAYLWANMLVSVMIPAVLSVGIATGLLLLVRVDRRLDQLQLKTRAE